MASYTNDEILGNNLDILGEIIKNIISMLNYCFACNRCVNICPLSHLNLFYPRILIEDLRFSPLEDVIKNHNIWNCLTCGQCTTYCPMTQENEGVRIPELILELRKMVRNNKEQIERIVQCETHNDIFAVISKMMAENPINPTKLEFLKDKSLKTSSSGEIAYYIGCLPLMDEIFYNFNFNYTDIPITIINLLNDCGIAPVVLNEKCCGHDILWGKGDIDTFEKLAKYNTKLYKDAGVKTIIIGCAEGYRTWKFDYPKIIEDFEFKVLHFSEFFIKEKILEKLKFPYNSKIKATYHDSCRIGRLGGKLYDAPRELIKKIPGVELIEMENIKNDASCCGVSAFTNCNEFTRVLTQRRINEAIKTGADYLIVTCPKCLTHFNCYLNEYSIYQNNELRNKIKVVDLARFIGKLLMLF
ncbi:MAG: (Fe-S)-binding protein [Candidatus Thorarchaeota archaeon]